MNLKRFYFFLCCLLALASTAGLASEQTRRILWFNHNLYRWIDPQSGMLRVTPQLPEYPIKERQVVGKLPLGKLFEVFLDESDPEVKNILERRAAEIAEQKKQTLQVEAEAATRMEQARLKETAKQEALTESLLESQRKQQAHEAALKREAEAQRLAERTAFQRSLAEKAAIEDRLARAETESKDNPALGNLLILYKAFDEQDKQAARAPRRFLWLHIEDLAEIRRKLEGLTLDKCHQQTLAYLKTWMNLRIEQYKAFAANQMTSALDNEEMAQDAYHNAWQNYPESCHRWW